MKSFTIQKVEELMKMGEIKAANKLSLEEIEMLIETAATCDVKFFFKNVKRRKEANIKKVRERLARLESELSISFETSSHDGLDDFSF